jgi:hypothetical protein
MILNSFERESLSSEFYEVILNITSKIRHEVTASIEDTASSYEFYTSDIGVPS